jgi:predicted Rossmann fold nucleotide-binding protein DprA/Smf involved in DNA uptake
MIETLLKVWPWAGWMIALLGAIYYSPRKVIEQWNWYLARYRDEQVLDITKQRETRTSGGLVRTIPYEVVAIATQLRRSEASIHRSLMRLKRQGKVKHEDGGWCSS